MNANELRIGNWVQINPPGNQQSGICMVEVIKHSSVYLHCESDDYFVADVSFEKIKPIPLVPEILEKCGFRNSSSYSPYFHEKMYGELIEGDDGFYLQDTESEFITEKPFKYVHELQNLYFALTGEELQVNF